jgi:predicted Rdx family selenoprotein
LIQSSGGVFEIEHNGQLVYSKKATGRFPEDGEIAAICKLVDTGTPLDQAQAQAAEKVQHPPSFSQWLTGLFKK